MMDNIDIALIDVLQRSGRTRRNDLADKVGLSIPSVSERLRKLEEAGIITGYHAKVDHKKLGKDITAFIMVAMDSSKHFPTFVDKVQDTEEIMECHAITGDGTHILKIRTDNTASLEKLLSKIQSWSGVTKTNTSIVLSSPKETTRIKLPPYHK